MNEYKNYGDSGYGYNNYNSNYEYQLYLARGNERRQLSKNAFRLGVLLLIYELCQFVFSLVFEVVYVSIKSSELVLRLSDVSTFFNDNPQCITTTFEMAYTAAVIGASFVVLMIAAWAFYKIDLRSVYRFDRSHKKTIAVCTPAIMLINVTIAIVIGIVTQYLGGMGIAVPKADFSYSDASASAFFFQILYGVIMAPIIEETIYRGITIHLLKPYGKGMAVVISSMIFGLMHGNIAQAVNGFCFGLIMGSIVVSCNSVIPTICMHMINNALAQIPDIADITGSDMLYEIYLAIMIVCFVIGLLMIFANHKKIHLPKDDGCVLGRSERYKTAMLSAPMVLYWLYIGYIFIRSFIRVNL